NRSCARFPRTDRPPDRTRPAGPRVWRNVMVRTWIPSRRLDRPVRRRRSAGFVAGPDSWLEIAGLVAGGRLRAPETGRRSRAAGRSVPGLAVLLAVLLVGAGPGRTAVRAHHLHPAGAVAGRDPDDHGRGALEPGEVHLGHGDRRG